MLSNRFKKIDKKRSTAVIVATLTVFATTFFAMADNKSANSVFLDKDQDGLTDQEEKALETNPNLADTDGDGYSDGAEIKSGYNPLKAAPGDKLFSETSDIQSVATETKSADSDQEVSSEKAIEDKAASLLGQSSDQLSALVNQDAVPSDIVNDLSSDPENPNLTNEMIGQLLQTTLDKAGETGDSVETIAFSQDDFSSIAQKSLQTASIAKDLPEIRPDEMKILPAVDDKDLSKEEIKEKQKKEIEKYLSSLAFVFASNSPFSIDEPTNLSPKLSTETDSLVSALATGNTKKIDEYAQKARASMEQVKKIEVPYVLKDIHKSILQLSIYTLDFKDDLSVNPTDPLRSLAAFGSLQSVGESALKIQGELKSVLDEYGIDSVEFEK